MHWKFKLTNGEEIEQYKDGEDNTLRLKELLAHPEVESISLVGEADDNVCLNIVRRELHVGNTVIPFMIENPKLIYFMTRQVTTTGDFLYELPITHTLGMEDKNGKLFFNIREDGYVFISNCNP